MEAEIEQNRRYFHGLDASIRLENVAYPYGLASVFRKGQLGNAFRSSRGILPGVNSDLVDLHFLRATPLIDEGYRHEWRRTRLRPSRSLRRLADLLRSRRGGGAKRRSSCATRCRQQLGGISRSSAWPKPYGGLGRSYRSRSALLCDPHIARTFVSRYLGGRRREHPTTMNILADGSAIPWRAAAVTQGRWAGPCRSVSSYAVCTACDQPSRGPTCGAL
jgi:hypothetical protein